MLPTLLADAGTGPYRARAGYRKSGRARDRIGPDDRYVRPRPTALLGPDARDRGAPPPPPARAPAARRTRAGRLAAACSGAP